MKAGTPINDERLNPAREVPPYARNYTRIHSGRQ
jgi:hypothetical protein